VAARASATPFIARTAWYWRRIETVAQKSSIWGAVGPVSFHSQDGRKGDKRVLNEPYRFVLPTEKLQKPLMGLWDFFGEDYEPAQSSKYAPFEDVSAILQEH